MEEKEALVEEMKYKPSKWILETLLENFIIARNNGKTHYSPYNLILKDLQERLS